MGMFSNLSGKTPVQNYSYFKEGSYIVRIEYLKETNNEDTGKRGLAISTTILSVLAEKEDSNQQGDEASVWLNAKSSYNYFEREFNAFFLGATGIDLSKQTKKEAEEGATQAVENNLLTGVFVKVDVYSVESKKKPGEFFTKVSWKHPVKAKELQDILEAQNTSPEVLARLFPEESLYTLVAREEQDNK